MGYLNNTSVTIDAILTKKGRELLAKNDGSFRITQFSLSDDETHVRPGKIATEFRFLFFGWFCFCFLVGSVCQLFLFVKGFFVEAL